MCHKVNCVPPLMSHALDILVDLFGVLLARSECGVVGYGGGWIRSPVVGLGGFSDQASSHKDICRALPRWFSGNRAHGSLPIALNLSHRRHTLVTIQSQPWPCPVLLYFCCTCHCFSLRHVCPRLFVEYACVQPTPHTQMRDPPTLRSIASHPRHGDSDGHAEIRGPKTSRLSHSPLWIYCSCTSIICNTGSLSCASVSCFSQIAPSLTVVTHPPHQHTSC